MDDPTVFRIASSGGPGGPRLCALLAKHRACERAGAIRAAALHGIAATSVALCAIVLWPASVPASARAATIALWGVCAIAALVAGIAERRLRKDPERDALTL